MIVGFTGTQLGMTEGQIRYLKSELKRVKATNLHHGCCIGADKQANDLARSIKILTEGHPPIITDKMARCIVDIMHPPKDYIPRNHEIVDMCDLLFVAPRYNYEEQRSGTWATFRYADKIGRTIIMIER
jgi:hypothetical protein